MSYATEDGDNTMLSLPKRLRLHSDSTSINSEKASDFYDDILTNSNYGTITTIYNSWLRKDRMAPTSDSNSLDAWPDPIVDQTHMELMQNEIKHLTAQLTLVKRRLSPSAERCAKACNASMRQSHTTGNHEFMLARRACNPMECLGEGRDGGLNSSFINRSAVKLANIDALLDFTLTRCHYWEPFLFVDLCGAPGGFSEYLLHRCLEQGVPYAVGYGMSLNGTNEFGRGLRWKINEEAWMHNNMYSQFKICNGADGTGDIFQWSNVIALRDCIRDDFSQSCQTNADPEMAGVQLVVADGGVDAQRENENQEQTTQKLIVCQVAAALELLRTHGTFVLKMFGFQTPVVRSVMMDLSGRFEEVRILKPISSRPASAERYVVFNDFKGREASWNAQHWQSRMFLCIVPTSTSLRFTVYLDMCDRDMLFLNLKACFNILSFLESKGWNADKSNDVHHQVDVSVYGRAWRLL